MLQRSYIVDRQPELFFKKARTNWFHSHMTGSKLGFAGNNTCKSLFRYLGSVYFGTEREMDLIVLASY